MAADPAAGLSPAARRRYLAARRRNPTAARAFDRLSLGRRREIASRYEGPGRRDFKRLVIGAKAQAHVEKQIDTYGARDIDNEPRLDLLSTPQLHQAQRMSWAAIESRAKERRNHLYSHLEFGEEFTLAAPNPFWYH